MKATLSFDLDKEGKDHLIALKGKDLLNVVCEMDRSLRNKVKYQSQQYSVEERKCFEEIRNTFKSMINESDLNALVYGEK